MQYRLALLLAGLSGGAALSHELLWTRRLIDLLGASTQTSARVFECFFLGLALGAAFSTRLAQRTRRPWRVVAMIEAGIAILSVPALIMPYWTDWIWPWLGPDRLVSGVGAGVKLTVSVVVMIPPTFLLGMTLPLMARAVLAGDRTLGRQGVWLYGVNTLGGVVGLLWTTTLLLPLLSVAGAMVTAAVLNLIIAGLCVWLDGRAVGCDEVPVVADDAPVRAGDHDATDAVGSDRGRLAPSLLFMAFASGGGVLGIEVLSMHLFMQVAPSAIHAVAAVLGAVILLLAVAALVTPVLISKRNQAKNVLVPTLMIAGLATASAPLLFMWLTNQMVTIRPSSSIMGFILKMTGYVLVTIGPSLLLTGLVLPMVFTWFSEEGGDSYGRRWGWLLAVNGVGGIVGAEVAQHLVMPVVWMHLGLGVFGLGYGALAAWMVWVNDGWRAWRGEIWRPIGVMVVILVISAVWLIHLRPIHPAPTKKIKFKMLDVAAGSEGVVVVTESDELGRGIVMFNQYVLGSTAGMADEQRQAHLPIILHSQPRRVAFIGLATGITAGAALMHDNVESVTAIELSKLVANACQRHFSSFTNDLFADPRTDVVVEDGRTYIASCEDRFDVIMGDLFLPWRPGVGRLYSLEHFQAVRRSLRAGGLFCQMLPMYQFSQDQQEVVLTTFLQVFPQAYLFRLGFNAGMPVLAIVGFKDGDMDWEGMDARCRRLRERNKISDPLIRHHEGIGMLYMGSVMADDWPSGVINTLGNAWIELTAGQDFVTGKWGHDYFMDGSQWLAFERRMNDRLRSARRVPGLRPDLSRLGTQITRWAAIRDDASGARDHLYRQIHLAMPPSLKEDLDADHSAWHGWPALLRH